MLDFEPARGDASSRVVSSLGRIIQCKTFFDLDRYPLGALAGDAGLNLLDRCRRDLTRNGMFTLEGLLKEGAAERIAAELRPTMETSSFLHKRRHNIYFDPDLAGVPVDHPVRAEFETANRTICADQMAGSLLMRIYGYRPLIKFLAAVMEKTAL